MQIGKDFLDNIRKIDDKFGSATCVLLQQFYAIRDCDMVSYSFNVSKRVMFGRALSRITPFNMIVELGSSNIITDSVNNEAMKFIQKYVYRAKVVEKIVETRMRQFHEIETKRTQVILPYPNSLT